MNWTDLKDIEQKIVEKRYSDSEAFNYFLGTAILYTLGCFLFLEDYVNSYKLAVIPALIITVVGSVYSYRTYTSNEGSDFFRDYFALSWVVGWRIFFYGFLFIFLSIIAASILTTSISFEPFDLPETNLFKVIFQIIMGQWYYILLYRSFKRVSLGKPYKSKGR
jgi:hypothetical protein